MVKCFVYYIEGSTIEKSIISHLVLFLTFMKNQKKSHIDSNVRTEEPKEKKGPGLTSTPNGRNGLIGERGEGGKNRNRTKHAEGIIYYKCVCVFCNETQYI